MKFAQADVIGTIGNLPITAESITSEFPTALGLAMIPIVVKPLDSLTERILELFIIPKLEQTYPNCCNL
jgi:hypothetical protein